MSSAASHFAYTGEVRCTRRGAHCHLQGTERDTHRPMKLLLVAGDDAALPASMADLELRRLDGGDGLRWQLAWSGAEMQLTLRSVHVQRAGSAALAAAMPGVAPSWRGRVGWALLLNLVRVPGITRLLRTLRGAG
jgi:hypothetical protein